MLTKYFICMLGPRFSRLEKMDLRKNENKIKINYKKNNTRKLAELQISPNITN